MGNFDNFPYAFSTVFQICTLDSWNAIMYNMWRMGGVSMLVYPMSLVALGGFIFIKLFVAILLGNFNAALADMETVVKGDVKGPTDDAIVERKVEMVKNDSFVGERKVREGEEIREISTIEKGVNTNEVEIGNTDEVHNKEEAITPGIRSVFQKIDQNFYFQMMGLVMTIGKETLFISLSLISLSYSPTHLQ